MEAHATYSKAEWAFVPKRFYFVKENATLDFSSFLIILYQGLLFSP
jgi:hypothetical protein